MNKAKDLLLTLLPSASNIVRRAVSEGLALLATLGVTEDAHFLQSTVLHSLDEVMQGNKPDGKPRAIALEPISAARAGSLLTLACIQRTSYKVHQRQLARARGRATKSSPETASNKGAQDLPLLQMMTRILPSTTCQGMRDYFVVRTYAIHSYSILLAYSSRLNDSSNSKTMDDDVRQLLRKAVEVVEDNFASAWTIASADNDRGQEAERMAYEIAFLAVLIRLMTFLVPHLRHLRCDDFDTCRRFLLMTSMVLEEHGSHPAIVIEAMAFYEVVSDNLRLLPNMSAQPEYLESSAFSIVQNALCYLKPQRLSMNLRLQTHPCWSLSQLRAVCCAMKAVSFAGVSIYSKSEMEVVAGLLTTLECVSGWTLYSASNIFRSIAIPRDTEDLLTQDVYLEKDISSLLISLLRLESLNQNNLDSKLFRYILMSRSLLTGASQKESDDEQESSAVTIETIVSSANSRAIDDCQAVWSFVSSIRWQVKVIAAQLLHTALGCMKRYQFSTMKSHFSFGENKRLTAHNPKSTADTTIPPSKLVYHLRDLVSVACLSAGAAVDQSELVSIQGCAISVLDLLVGCFTEVDDPDIANTSILEQFSQQIYSAIKHCLTPHKNPSSAELYLLIGGSECLTRTVTERLTSDEAVLKRLLRTLLYDDDEAKILSALSTAWLQQETAKDDLNTNFGLSQVARSAGLCSLMFESRQSPLKSVVDELVSNKVPIAMHCAASAIDGCRILIGSQLSLVGRKTNADDDNEEEATVPCAGYLYRNMEEVNDTQKSLITGLWAKCVCASLYVLAGEVSKTDTAPATVTGQESKEKESTTEHVLYLRWIRQLAQMLVQGCVDSLHALSDTHGSNVPKWSTAISASDIANSCLQGLTVLAQSGITQVIDEIWDGGLDTLLDVLQDVLFGGLLAGTLVEDGVAMLEHASVFLQALSSMHYLSQYKSERLLLSLLQPLHALQSGSKLDFANAHICKFFSSCLESVGMLISRKIMNAHLPTAVLHLVLDLTEGKQTAFPLEVEGALNNDMMICLSSGTIDSKRQSQIACRLAAAKRWERWSIMLKGDDGQSCTESFATISNLIQSGQVTPHEEQTLLSAIRTLVQQQPSSQLVEHILSGMGVDILGLLLRYGTSESPAITQADRQSICTDAVAVLLVGYRHLASTVPEDLTAAFVSSVFGVMLAVLRYNGLPNQQQAHGDPSIGRVCAQACLLVARTTPNVFKSYLGILSDQDRGLVELAVRGEMTGYATSGPSGGTKKVLNLSGFRK
jgi:hypothetical protein